MSTGPNGTAVRRLSRRRAIRTSSKIGEDDAGDEEADEEPRDAAQQAQADRQLQVARAQGRRAAVGR